MYRMVNSLYYTGIRNLMMLVKQKKKNNAVKIIS